MLGNMRSLIEDDDIGGQPGKEGFNVDFGEEHEPALEKRYKHRRENEDMFNVDHKNFESPRNQQLNIFERPDSYAGADPVEESKFESSNRITSGAKNKLHLFDNLRYTNADKGLRFVSN